MAFCDRFRYVIAVFTLGSTMSVYIGRHVLSMAMPSMTHHLNGTEVTGDVCPAHSNSSSNSTSSGGQFDWTKTEQGILLSAFFYAYVCMQVPAGLLIERFGPRILTSAAIIATGVIGLVTPYLAPYLWLLITSRIVLGIVQGSVFPGTYRLIAKWIPPNERGTAVGCGTLGSGLGSIIAHFLTGYLCYHVSWESAFILPGIATIIFGLVYAILVTDHPKDHFLVSANELEHIQTHNHSDKSDDPVNVDSKKQKKAQPFPWKDLLTSKIVWATTLVKFSTNFNSIFMGYNGPSYMNQVLGVNVYTSGYCLSIIFGVGAACNLISGMLADMVLRFGLNRTTTRKVFQSIGTFSMAISYLLLPLSDCDWILFVIILGMCTALSSLTNGGEGCIYTDLTSEFTATLYAFANGVSSLAAISPTFFGLILDAFPHLNKHVWSYIFYFIGGCNVLGGIAFLWFVSAEPLNWGESTVAVGSRRQSRLSQNLQVDGAKVSKRRRRSIYAIEDSSCINDPGIE